jgi:hypothetical protein
LEVNGVERSRLLPRHCREEFENDSNEESLESRREGGDRRKNWRERMFLEWMFLERLLQVKQGLPGRAIGLARWRLA